MHEEHGRDSHQVAPATPGTGPAAPSVPARLREIGMVLYRSGLGTLVRSLHLESYIPMGRLIFRAGGKPTVSEPEALRRAFEALGPTFVKLGQFLSIRSDLIPEEYTTELAKLQDQVPPVPEAAIRAVVERELGAPVRQLFARWDEAPLAAASVAQVHRAALQDGREVIVKVQRPGIAQVIEVDLKILSRVARALMALPEMRVFDPPLAVEEFRRTLARELDFRREARSMERFAANFSDSHDVYAPDVIWDRTSTRVLTMIHSAGRRITALSGEDHVARHALAQRLVEASLKQVFEDGFFHGDPHPGNIFLLPDGRLCFHDFGIVGSLDPATTESLGALFVAFMNQDMDGLVDEYMALGVVPRGVDRRALKSDLAEAMEDFFNRPLKEVSLGEAMVTMVRIGRRHGIRQTPGLLLLGKMLLTLDGVVRQIDPEFNLVEEVKAEVAVVLRKRLRPSQLAQDLAQASWSFLRMAREAPAEVRQIFRNLQEGKLGEIEHRGFEGFQAHMDRASNRLTAGIVVAALVIGSAIVTQSHFGPHWAGVPLVGLGGFVIAALSGLWLLWGILRSGRL